MGNGSLYTEEHSIRERGPVSKETPGVERGSQPEWRLSGSRVSRAARWLGFKSLMHRLAEQWRQGAAGEAAAGALGSSAQAV